MSTSFTKVKASDLQAACTAYLEARKQRIDAQVERLIDKEMNRRFFPPKTRDAARANLREAIFDLNWAGGYWANLVEDLLDLSKVSVDGYVNLTARDVSVIENFWP